MWFEELTEVIRDFGVLSENIYNMDESGYNIGDCEERHAVVDTTIKHQYQSQPSRQEWVSTLECIGLDRTFTPPLILFRGENFVAQWVSEDFDPTWRFGNTENGWTSNKYGLRWMRECFEPYTREKAAGGYRLLIWDGHGSHCTPEILTQAFENRILVFRLVAHSSHLTQPLDSTIFGPLKRVLGRYLAKIWHRGVQRISKADWLKPFYEAHQEVFTPKNIKNGFSSTSIHPFNPSKVLNCIPKAYMKPPSAS